MNRPAATPVAIANLAAGHLSKAAEHLFGKASSKAHHWFTSWRHKRCHEEGAVDRLLRSLAYHRGQLKKGSQRYGQVSGEMGYFTKPVLADEELFDRRAGQTALLIVRKGSATDDALWNCGNLAPLGVSVSDSSRSTR